MADEVASLLVRITADGSQAVGVLNGIQATVGTLADSNATTMNKIAASGALASKVGMTITKTFGIATVAGLTASAKAAGQLNKELANIGTLSVPTEKLKQYKGQIQDIAIATGKSTSDISEGTYQVVSAFGDAADTMEKVEINAKAARAGLATTADSINLTSAVTKAYGDTSAAAVQHVADLAFKTVELGQTTFPELASSMQQVTSLSKELGVSQEELFASYATLTGVTGNAAEVQTQMKAIYTALLKPSENMTKAIKKQGYESGYTMIKTLGFAGTLDALKKATNGSEEEMLGLFNNVRAMPAVMALTGAQYDTFNTKLEKMKNASGAATKAFEVQTEGIAKTGFTLEQAKIKMEVAAQRFGESAAPIIADFADVVDKASDKLANMSDEERKAIINTGVLTTKIGIGLAVGGKVLTVGTKIVGTVNAVAGALGAADSAVVGVAGTAASALAPVGALAALMAVVGVKEKYFNYDRGMRETSEQIQTATNGLGEYVSLIEEVNKNKLIIKSDASSKEEVEAAKKRIEEIAGMLGIEYSMDIDVDTTALDEALEKAAELKRVDIINNSSKYLDKLYKGEKSYSHDKELVEEYEKKKSAYEATINKYGNLAAQAERAKAAFDRERIDETEYIRQAQSIYDQAIAKGYKFAQPELQNGVIKTEFAADILVNGLTGDANFSSAALNTIAKEASDAKERMNELEESARNTGNAFTQALAADVKNGDAFGIETDIGLIQDLSEEMTKLGIPTTELGIQFAASRMGYTDFNTALGEGGKNAQQMAQYFIEYEQSIGASANETVTGAALIQNGFRSIEEAAQAGKLDIISQQATEIARSMGEIPDDKRIEISATGDISLIDEATNKVEKIQNENVTVTVNADGDISIIDEATGKEQALKGLGDVHIQINGDGDIEILDEAEQKIAEIDGESGEITVNGEYPGADEIKKAIEDQNKVEEKETNLKVNGEYPGKEDVAQALSDQEALKDKSVTYTVNYAQNGTKPKENATGTQNFPGGLAMVNDQRGVADPRELIEHNGKLMMFEGRDVILPLSKGDKVYTAAQTKAIMRGMGIPHYAGGKNNSDAFTSARDDWSHYTRTHAVTTVQELEKWLEFQKQFRDNEKDLWDIDEQIFLLRQKITQEQNKASQAYIAEHSALNDWDSIGDSAIAAFARVRDRNLSEVEAQRMTWEDFNSTMSSVGSSMYSDRIRHSEKWLAHEEKYNDLSAADYMAGIDRMREYTEEYYARGLISHKEYVEGKIELDEMYIDKQREANADEFAAWQKDADAWEELRDTYDDWDEVGDNKLDFYQRKIDKVKALFEQQKIGFEEFIDYTNKYEMDKFKYQKQLLEDGLGEMQTYINEMRTKFSEEEQALRDSWTVADRRESIEDLEKKVRLYSGAVTERGQEQLKQYQEQLKQAQREEELYRIQQDNKATIEKLEAEYKIAEDNKKVMLRGVRADVVNVQEAVNSLMASVKSDTSSVETLLSRIETAIKTMNTGNTTNYNDNSKKTTVNKINQYPTGVIALPYLTGR